MHLGQAKSKCDKQMDGQMDDEQRDSYVTVCFAGITKIMTPKEKSSKKHVTLNNLAKFGMILVLLADLHLLFCIHDMYNTATPTYGFLECKQDLFPFLL